MRDERSYDLVFFFNFNLPISAVGVKGGTDGCFSQRFNALIPAWYEIYVVVGKVIHFPVVCTEAKRSVLVFVLRR